MSPEYLALILLLVLAAVSYAAYRTWQDYRNRRLQRIAEEAQRRRREAEQSQVQPRLPDGARYISQTGIEWDSYTEVSPTQFVVGIATYGAHMVLNYLVEMKRLGLHNRIGSVLVIESDKSEREKFLANLPACYRDHTTVATVDRFPGMANRGYDYVLGKMKHWAPYIYDATMAAIRHYQHRARTPGDCIVFAGMGGQSPLGPVAVSYIKAELPEVQIVVAADMPTSEGLRDTFHTHLKNDYDAAGVHGHIVTDSLDGDSLQHDTTLVRFFAGYTAAELQPEGRIRLNNLFTRVLGDTPGRLATITYTSGAVVAYELGGRYYAFADDVLHKTLTLIDTIEAGNGIPAVSLSRGQDRHDTYDLTLAPFNLTDLRYLDDHLAIARNLGATSPGAPSSLWKTANYHSTTSVWAPSISRSNPLCKLALIRVQVLTDYPDLLSDLVTVPSKRKVQRPPQPLGFALPVPSTNGTEEPVAHGAP